MSEKEFSSEEYVQFMAPLAGIVVDDTWLSSIALHVATAKNMADIMDTVELENDSLELANTFVP